MKINSIKLPFTKKSFLLLCFFACMFVFASFTREDREKVREFKKELMSKWTGKKVDLLESVNEAESLRQSLTKENKDFSPASTFEFNSKKESVESLNNNEIAGNSTFYSSKEKEGTIGTFSDKEDDRISDNFFTIDIPTVNKENISAYLEYDLFGLASHESVSRSINHNIAIGGEIIVPSAEWSHQKEAINPNLIKDGANSILFTSPAAGVKYKIKNLKVVFEKNNRSGNNLNVSSVLSGDQLYVKGNTGLSTNLTINNEHVAVKNGEFEKVIQLSAQEKASGSFSIMNGGISNAFKIPGTTKSFKIINDSYFNSKGIEISKDKEFNIDYEGMKVSVEKETSESAYIEVLKLREKDFPVTSQGLKNITLDNTAYRFSLVSGKLNKKVKLTIPYDLKRLGMFSPKEIKVFHFDYTKKEWVMDSSPVVDEKAQTVTVEGDGDNDYINGIISTPESPQLNAFAPTSISGLKAADPMTGNQILSAPTGNQKGDANMNYPIKVPSGLGGLQPSVSIGYSSAGGNAWMGEGWDIQGLSSISIDTRWGSPLFDGATETELYSLDGEMLVYPNGYLPHRHNDKSETDPTVTTERQARTTGTKQFYLRKNHDFSIIERLGTGPTDYSWKVTSTDGTKSYYGGSTDSVIKNSDNQIVHWALRLVEDSNGNTMAYSYQNTALSSLPTTNNLKDGIYFHIKQISYGKSKEYTVKFNTQTAISRSDLNINAKQGVKRVEPYLLTNVDVNYKDQIIRSYQMEYENGQFSKTRLKRMYIRTPGDISKNLIIDDYSFEYYDDVADAQGNVTIFDSDKSITVNNSVDAYGSLTQNAVNPSKINGNTAYEWGLNFRPAFGLNLFYPSNDAYGHIMFGVPFGFSNAEAKNVQQLIDFNGDGIQDMIYRVPNDGLYYSEGSFSPSNGDLTFAGAKKILNFNSNFSYTKTKSSNWGFDVGLQVWNKGTTNSKSLSTTSTYLTDANSDGLMDIVSNGDVWFNKYNDDKRPEMTRHSEYTENMILKTKPIAPIQFVKSDISIAEPPVQNIDVVRVWVAPKDGYVRFSDEISAAPSFIAPGGIVPVPPKAIYSVEILNPNNSGNNMRIYLGQVDENSLPAPINITNYNTYFSQISNMPPLDPNTNHLGTSNPNRLFVKSGDKILVRLHKNIGTNLEIVSNPTVTYVDGGTGSDITNTIELAQDGFSLNNGSYGDNLLMNNAIAPILLDAPGTVTIKIDPVTFPYSTDKFTFDIIKENLVTNVATSLMPTNPPIPNSYEQSDVPFTTFDIGTTVPAITFTVAANEKFLLKFIVKSDSHTSFINANWNKAINVEYNANTNIGDTLLKFNAVPQYPSYVVTQFSKKTDIKDPLVNNTILPGVKDYKVQINKNITNFSNLGIGSFYYVIKKGSKVLAKRRIIVDEGNISVTEQDMLVNPNQPITGISPVSFFSGDVTRPDGFNKRLINIQIYCDSDGSYALYKKYAAYFQNKPFNIYYDSNNTYLISVIHTSINSAIYNGKTLMNNNWGQFLYNPLQDSTSAVGIVDSYGRLLTENVFSDNAAPQQIYPQCNQYANQPDLLYPCIANSMPSTANQQNTGSGSGQPIIPMKTSVIALTKGRFMERWVGTGPNQFSSRTSFKDDDETAGYATSPIADAPEVAPSTLTTGQSPSLDTTMRAIDKKQSSQSINKTVGGNLIVANVGNSETTLTGQGSVEIQNFMDLNGDGYPDIVYPDNIQLTNSTGSLENQQPSFTIGSYLTDSYSKQKTKSASFSYSSFSAIARGNVFGSLGIRTMANSSMGWSGDVSAGVTTYDVPESTDYGKTFWLDLNGDGLPDRITNGGSSTMYYELNLGKKLYGGQPFTNLRSYQSHPVGAASVSIGGGLGGTTNLQSLGSFGFGVNAGVGASSSIGSADVLYEDVNGDGMIDILEVNNSNTSVRYNLGNRFDDSKPLLKTGSTIDFTNETQSYNGSLSFGGSFMFNIGPIFIVPILPILTLYIKAGLGGTANFGINISDVKKSFKDMNGDGFIDMIRDNGNGFTVNYSRIGRTNKLRTVTNNITQGKYTLDYQFSKPTYLDPHAKLVVKEIRVLNPDVFSTNYTNSDNAKDMVTRYRFENSKYDRRERDNFGFAKVIREEMNGTAVYRKKIDMYYNTNYFLGGMLYDSQIMTAANVLLSRVIYTYSLYKFKDNVTQINLSPLANATLFDSGGTEGRKMATVLLARKTKIDYETGGQIQTVEQMSYTSKGLLSKYQYTSPSNVYNSQMTYWTGIGSNMIAIPKQIDVYEGTTSAIRIRQRKSLNVNPTTGDIGKFVVFDGANNIETDYTYDSYGNVQSILYPPNEFGQRYSLNYQYDTADTNKYVTSVTDNYGVTSSTEYNPLFDAVAKSTDITGNTTQYTYDGFGRITSIKGPNEAGITTPTILYSYDFANYGIPNTNQAVKIFMAQTAHYDEGNPSNAIKTNTYADFMGRVIQVKKDIEVNGVERRSVSGRTIYDPLGRVATQYHPKDEVLSAQNTINLTTGTGFSTSNVYDTKDREIQETNEDAKTKYTGYIIESGLLKTTETFETMKSETYTNAEGQIVSKNNYLDSVPLKTTYEYNKVGELMKTTDPFGISTIYNYNLAGRRINMSNPDKGKTSYEYDAAGNLVRLWTDNLANDPNITVNNIHYKYHYNRLTDIELPNLPNGTNPNNVHYEYLNGGNGTGSGRLFTKSDGTGSTIYSYGKMGEITSEDRTVFGYNIPTMNFKTYFSYDSWNRIKQIMYPDGEQVSYKYDLGGNLKSVSNTSQDYIKNITYDLYEQRTQITFGNGMSSQYSYQQTNRRLSGSNLFKTGSNDILSNSYSYDPMGNITKLVNFADVSQNGMGGAYYFTYVYDTLNRLIGTEGSQRLVDKGGNPITPGVSPFPESNSGFKLRMVYNDFGGIANKTQQHNVNQQANTLNTYNNTYNYITGTHKVKAISDATSGNSQSMSYDFNGNVISHQDEFGGKKMVWDEQDRMKAFYSDDSGVFQYYAYDDSGERIIKYNMRSGSQLYQNGALIDPGTISLYDYKLYPNPYVVITSNGQYTKNYFEGSTRFASRINDGTDIFISTTTKVQKDANVKEPNPELDFKTYLDKAGVEGNVSLELAGKNSGWQAGLYYLHTDHLGSATYITDDHAEPTQFFLNLPFGETMLEQQTGVYNNPYKFNAKEQDKETGLYYYGARYYNPRLSVWYGVDPLAAKMPSWSPYTYSFDNPINFVDLDGKEPTPKEAVAMAAHVYGDKKDDILLGGWRVSKRNFGIQLYDRKSGFKSLVYERVVGGKVTEYSYVTAGTEDWRDIKEDGAQAVVPYAPQYGLAAKNSKILSSRLGNTELTFVGHSLGGGLAAMGALVTGRKGITFNAAGVSNETQWRYGGRSTMNRSESNIDAYIMETDPLNIVQNNFILPHVNGKRHYLQQTMTPWTFKTGLIGHSVDTMAREYRVNPNAGRGAFKPGQKLKASDL